MGLIKKFNYEDELRKINDWIKGRRLEMKKDLEEKINNSWINEIMTGFSDEYAEANEKRNLRYALANQTLEDALYLEWIAKIGEMVVSSVSYVSSILSPSTKKIEGKDIAKFLISYSDRSQKARDLISFWIRIRNQWEHKARFPKGETHILQYFPKKKIDMTLVLDYMRPIFKKVNDRYPHSDFLEEINSLANELYPDGTDIDDHKEDDQKDDEESG